LKVSDDANLTRLLLARPNTPGRGYWSSLADPATPAGQASL